jgi:hypothetical protein
MYDASTENLEHAVALYVMATAESQKMPQSALLTASIIFSAMAVEAAVVGGVNDLIVRERAHGEHAKLRHDVCESILREMDRKYCPYDSMKKWSRALLEEGALDFGASPFQEYDAIVKYRNAALHSDRRRVAFVAERTTQDFARRAISTAVEAMIVLGTAYGNRGAEWISWWRQICAPLGPPL